MMDHIRVFVFGDTGEAYDACQCCDEIRSGDVLLIPSENVAGIADTWPFAVTAEAGNLHVLLPTVGLDKLATDIKVEPESLQTAVRLACGFAGCAVPGWAS